MKEIEFDKEVSISVGDIEIEGHVTIPENAKGLILFSHGSGSSRFSPRNNFVANELQKSGFGTFLFDLLTPEEDNDHRNRFDIELLTERLKNVTKSVKTQEETKHLNIGYFGASTGAASALNAAAFLGDQVKAVVSRGGRPDLAIPNIPEVKAPTLLIVGGDDTEVIEMNKDAQRYFKTKCEMEIIPGADHLFEEPGKLEEVANLAAQWFDKYM
jgi:putative phosphoribosyl transferase